MVEPATHIVRPVEFVWVEQVGENESGLAGSVREDINQFEDDLQESALKSFLVGASNRA